MCLLYTAAHLSCILPRFVASARRYCNLSCSLVRSLTCLFSSLTSRSHGNGSAINWACRDSEPVAWQAHAKDVLINISGEGHTAYDKYTDVWFGQLVEVRLTEHFVWYC